MTRRMFGLPYVVFRPHNVYGEGQNIADRYRNVVGIFMNQLLQGRPMTVFGDGEQQRAFTHVDDVAPLIAECVDVQASHDKVFNVGADVPMTVNHLAKTIADALGKPCEVEHLPPPGRGEGGVQRPLAGRRRLRPGAGGVAGGRGSGGWRRG